MIGTSRYGEPIRILQEDVMALRGQIAGLTDQMAALSSALAAERELSAVHTAGMLRLEDAAAKLEDIATAHAGMLATHAQTLGSHASAASQQADEIVSLRDGADQHLEQVRRIRADLTRVERQAAIDLDEMRKTSNAVAATVLLRGRGDVAPDNPPVTL